MKIKPEREVKRGFIFNLKKLFAVFIPIAKTPNPIRNSWIFPRVKYWQTKEDVEELRKKVCGTK